MKNVWQADLKSRLLVEYVKNPQIEWAELNVSTSGVLNLSVVSNCFEGLHILERKSRIQEILSQFETTSGFLALYTVEEANSLQLSPSQDVDEDSVKTWQDLAIWSANPQNQSQSLQYNPRLPRTVTFYSYKGGVGRTTALTHVAWILAMRGRKVVAVDLDLEAPGLSTALNLEPKPKYGIVDYFYDRSYLPDGTSPNIPITQIFGEVKIPNASGRLFIVPAGFLSLDYISKVDDLRANAISSSGETLWSIFKREIQEQLKPDVILIDSRTGINEWGALSLLQAADEVIIFLFPNEQNRQGVELILKSLNSFENLSVNFVFSPVPDTSDIGLAKIKTLWQSFLESMNNGVRSNDTNETYTDTDDSQSDMSEPLIVGYLPAIAMADNYPVIGLIDYYTRIANLVDEDTNETRIRTILTGTERRWEIIESLKFSALNAASPSQNLNEIFQKTSNFDKFLDETTCLIKGRKGTGKTALYLLLLKHQSIARQLAHSRLDDIAFFSGHGSFHNSRPSRDEFHIINQRLEREDGSWESFWRAYLLLGLLKIRDLKLLLTIRAGKFTELREILKKISGDGWKSEYTGALIHLSVDSQLRLTVLDALTLINDKQRKEGKILWFLYDDLDEDFPERGSIRQNALTGLFQFVQACDARRLSSIRFKIFLREDIWSSLNFDNKSHFNGRDLSLQWTRVDFLRLALRQAMQSVEFKNLVDRTSPVESIDQANEEILARALELLWGIRRRRGSNAKYVSRWVYERLTDSSGTTFPRSLSALLQGAKNQELTYKGLTSIQDPTDRLLRSKSLEVGLEKASEERCDAIRQEYPDLGAFFDSLEGVPALLPREDLCEIWMRTAQEVISTFDEFADFLDEIGVARLRAREDRYSFSDIYVYGFKMNRTGAK